MGNDEIKKEEKKEELGLSLNKKTLFAIFAVLAAIWIFVGVLTQVVPRGEYQIVEVDGHEQIQDGTYSVIEDYKIPIWKIVLSPILCFQGDYAITGGAIILMIILVGGAFLVLDKCGILQYILASLIKKFGKRKYVLMATLCFACMALSSISGILEESVTLVPLAVAVSLALGWDSLVGLGMSLVSVAWGFTAATFNPFNVVTVQKLADLKVFSGLWLRLILFAVVFVVLFLFLSIYARKIEKNPRKSIVYESDQALRDKYKIDDVDAVLMDKSKGKGAKAFLICMCIDLLCIVLDFAFNLSGMLSLPAMAVLFTVGGLTAGYLTGLRGKNLAKSFFQGAKTIAPAIPLIVFVIAITYILNEGKIMHTILHSLYGVMNGMSPYAAIFVMFAVIALLEFFIGSGTAKAFLVMPLMAPLADLIGVTRQSIVTTFCLADGFTNLLYPTSGIMIIAIGIVNVSYGKWLRWTWKLFALEFLVSAAFMLFMVFINYT